MGDGRTRPLVCDSGALIALERRDPLVIRVLELADEVHIPAGVLAQVWRDPSKQYWLSRVTASEEVAVHELNAEVAKAAGVLCGRSGTSDVIDASVVLLARELDGVVISSDPGDLLRIDPELNVRSC